MRTEQIKYLIEISEYHSLSAAAEKLCITTAALSLSVKSLEEELGLLLFRRTNKGVELTEEGKRFIEIGKRFLQDLHALSCKPDIKNDNYQGMLEILTGQNAIDQFFPQVICEFHKKYPNVYVNPIVENIKNGLQSLAKDDGKELLFCYDTWNSKNNGWGYDTTAYTFHVLNRARLYCVVSRKLSIAAEPVLSNDVFTKYPYLIFLAKSYSEADVESEKVRTSVNSTTACAQVISLNNQLVYDQMLYNGMGISKKVLLPLKNLHQDERMAYIPIEDENETCIYNFGYFTRRNHQLSAVAQVFIGYLKEYLAANCV